MRFVVVIFLLYLIAEVGLTFGMAMLTAEFCAGRVSAAYV